MVKQLIVGAVAAGVFASGIIVKMCEDTTTRDAFNLACVSVYEIDEKSSAGKACQRLWNTPEVETAANLEANESVIRISGTLTANVSGLAGVGSWAIRMADGTVLPIAISRAMPALAFGDKAWVIGVYRSREHEPEALTRIEYGMLGTPGWLDSALVIRRE